MAKKRVHRRRKIGVTKPIKLVRLFERPEKLSKRQQITQYIEEANRNLDTNEVSRLRYLRIQEVQTLEVKLLELNQQTATARSKKADLEAEIAGYSAVIEKR